MFSQGQDFHFEISGYSDKRGRDNESQLYQSLFSQKKKKKKKGKKFKIKSTAVVISSFLF